MAQLASTILRYLYNTSTSNTSTDHDWRQNTGYCTDKMYAIDSLESIEDFSGRALIYPSVKDSVPFNVDIFIQSISVPVKENVSITEAIGNVFFPRAFGMQAMEATISGFIADYKDNYDKTALVDLYKNYLRVEAVARRGQAPLLTYPHAAIVFAATSLNLDKSSENIDLVAFAMSVYILQATYSSGDDTITFDYLHAKEVQGTTNVQVVNQYKSQTSSTQSDVSLQQR